MQVDNTSIFNQCYLTVDVEEAFHVGSFPELVGHDRWDDFDSRVEQNTDRVLSLFDQHQATGTFFTLGWVADRYPGLVKRIQAQGHEIACHSYWHRSIFRLSREEFREDTRRAKDVLEQITGTPVIGYRAPSFSIIRETLWALEVLVEEGFQYDASIFPVHHDAYGIPDWDPRPRRVTTPSGPIVEIPASTVRFLGLNLPCGGGGYLRLLPLALNLMALRKISGTLGRPGVIYIHPWEFDPEQPRIHPSALDRLRHYTGLSKTASRIGRLLQEFSIKPMGHVLEENYAV